MVSNIVLLFISCISILTTFNSKILFVHAENEDYTDWDNSTTTRAEILEIFGRVFQSTIDEISSSLNESCYYKLTYLFTKGPDINNHYLIRKALLDSSKNKNDLSYFTQCMKKKYRYKFSNTYPQIVNMTFLITKVDKATLNPKYKNTSYYYTLDYYIGLCLPNVCNKDDFLKIFRNLNRNLGDFLYFDEDNTTIDLYPFDNLTPIKYDTQFILSMIPLAIIFFFIIFMILLFVTPGIFLSCCFRIRKAQNSQDDKQSGKYNKPLFIKFSSCFNLSQNWEELFNYTVVSSPFNNFSGLTNTKGLKAISMIFVIFGFTFFDLLNNVSGGYGQYAFMEVLNGRFYPIIYIGLKYSPRILFSCSGYILFYKFMCFLDDNVEEANSENKIPDSFTMVSSISEEQLNIESNNDKNEILKNLKKPRKIKGIYLGKFLLYQLPKYIMFILVSLFLRFTLSNLGEASPIWEIFKKNSLSSNSILGFLLTFIGGHLFDPKDQLIGTKSVFNFNYMIYNEMIFFIFGCLLIFVANKYRLRVDRFVLLFIFFIILTKFLFFIYLHYFHYYYSTLYFYTFDYAKIMTNPLFNLPYFLIGLFFGSLNYVVQKGMDYEESEEQSKEFLFLSVKYVNFFRKAKKRLIAIVFAIMGGIIIFILLINIMFIRLKEEKKEDEDMLLNKFFSSHCLNFIMAIDIEFFVFFSHWIFAAFYIKGNNFLNDFLSHSFWTIFEKIYFSFSLLVQPVILFILCHSDTRIQINTGNIILYSLISLTMVLITSIANYLIVELPLKRLMKFILYKGKDLNKERENMQNTEEEMLKFE